jgi:hypothetical protein
MRRYYFDLKFEGQNASHDEEGMQLPHVEAAQTEAARTLCDFARAMMKGKQHLTTLAVIVRDDDGLVLKADINFKIMRLH